MPDINTIQSNSQKNTKRLNLGVVTDVGVVNTRIPCQEYELATVTVNCVDMAGAGQIDLEGTLDGTNWVVMDSETPSVDGIINLSSGLSNELFVRINIAATGGGTPRFSVHLVLERAQSPFISIGATYNSTSVVGSGNIPGWATATIYSVGDEVVESNRIYTCLVAHTSGTFSIDLSGGNWQLIYDGVTIKTLYENNPDTNPFTDLAKARNDGYTHIQASASASWNIAHNLGKFPPITIVDGSGNQIFGDINYVDANNVVATFSTAITGTAYA